MKNKNIVFFVILFMIFAFNINLYSQNSSQKTSNLIEESKQLDHQILAFCKKIEGVISKYKLLSIKDIKTLPFQISYNQGKDYIYIEKHLFEYDELNPKRIKIKNIKAVKIFTNGSKISKIESIIKKENYYEKTITEVKIVDPSPTTLGTDDIVFTYILNNKMVLNGKPLSKIRNTVAFPVRNELKKNFYIPHLMYFYDTILNIAETYYKGMKDVDSSMTEFLKESTKYY